MGTVRQDKDVIRNEAAADEPTGTHSVPVRPSKRSKAAAWEAEGPAFSTRRITTVMEDLTGEPQAMPPETPEADDGQYKPEDFFALCEEIEAAAGRRD